MSKLTLGVLAGVAIAAAASVPSLAAPSASDITLTTGSTATTSAGAVAAPGAVHAAGAVQAATTTKATVAKPLPRVLIVTRTVRLNLPVTGKVGTTVTGFIQVVDSNGQVESPVAGVEVALQKKVSGSAKWVDVADDLTDTSGQVQVSFTVRTNTSWRAALKPATGKILYSKTVTSTASAQLTWAARPDMDVTHGQAVSYAFRVSPAAGTAHLEIATSPDARKWTAAKSVAVKPDGVVRQSVVFPSAGTWYVRGATGTSTTNAPGYTTALTVSVG
jgi:hypothetical protein